MTIDLTGVRAKITRGWDHLHRFDEEVTRWVRRHPYGLLQETEAEGREHTWTLELFRAPDDTTFGLLIGECAHAWRAALDNLVYAISRETADPARFAKYEGGLAFPIALTEASWDDALARHRLEGLGDPVVSEIQKRQPYVTGNPPEFTPLSVVRWLDDRDKHRLLHTFTAVVEPTQMRFDPEVPAGTDFAHGPAPYVHDAKVLKITMPEPKPEMQMVMDMFVQVSVQDAPWREDIRDLLGQAGQTVQRIAVQVAKAAGASF